jgi:hypothetical protein
MSADELVNISNSALVAELMEDGVDMDVIQECLAAIDSLPRTYEEAMNSKEAGSWKQAMDKEMYSILQHDTWEEAELPLRRKALGCRWVFTKKYDKDGNVIRYKARLVVKGYDQRQGVDFVETFSPVVKFKSIRILAALAAKSSMKMFQDDAPTAFLKGDLKETVYMKQIPGFPLADPSLVLKLLKTLYGLKQSPREWYHVISNYILSRGFVMSKADPCIYVRKVKEHTI